MSEQIQYNYYSTVATKTGENSFIFRGKRNMPNLVLQNGDSYISTKLTIHANDGTVEIEHEPITNYSKRVIAIFPVQLFIEIQLGESKEIVLNSIIPKSLRFDADDSGAVIFLNPTESPVGSVEGFCNSKKCKEIQDQLKKTNARLSKQETRPGGTMSDADYAALAARLAAMNGGAGGAGGGGDDGGELVCTPITDSEDNEMTLVGVTNTLSELEMSKAAENSVYHQAAINVVVFIGGFLLISKAVGGLYSYVANSLRNPSILTGIELLIVLLIIIIILIIYLGFVKGPKRGETPPQRKRRESNNLTLTYIALSLTISLILFMYLVYDYRKSTYAIDKKDIIDLANFKRIFGDRDCYNTLKFIETGIGGISQGYKEYIVSDTKPKQQ